MREGKTSFAEQGTNKVVCLQPKSDECVIVFHTDCDVFRKKYNLQDQRVADVLFFLKGKGMIPILAVVELKSEDYEGAVKQIKTIVQLLQSELPQGTKASYYGIVLLSSASPGTTEEKKLQRKLSSLNVTLKFQGGVRRGGKPFDIRRLIS